MSEFKRKAAEDFVVGDILKLYANSQDEYVVVDINDTEDEYVVVDISKKEYYHPNTRHIITSETRIMAGPQDIFFSSGSIPDIKIGELLPNDKFLYDDLEVWKVACTGPDNMILAYNLTNLETDWFSSEELVLLP